MKYFLLILMIAGGNNIYSQELIGKWYFTGTWTENTSIFTYADSSSNHASVICFKPDSTFYIYSSSEKITGTWKYFTDGTTFQNQNKSVVNLFIGDSVCSFWNRNYGLYPIIIGKRTEIKSPVGIFTYMFEFSQFPNGFKAFDNWENENIAINNKYLLKDLTKQDTIYCCMVINESGNFEGLRYDEMFNKRSREYLRNSLSQLPTFSPAKTNGHNALDFYILQFSLQSEDNYQVKIFSTGRISK